MKRSLATSIALFTILAPGAALAAEGGGEGHGSWLLLTLFLINFTAFVVILVWFFAPQAQHYFNDRTAAITSMFSRARGALAEAQDLADKAAARAGALERELKRLADELEAETAFQIGKAAEAARAGSQRIRRDAEMGATALAEAARRRVRERLAENATRLARELIAADFRASDQGRLIDNFMERLAQEGRR
jgi:F0F1-type ATP synthase membrane subunit b/b'